MLSCPRERARACVVGPDAAAGALPTAILIDIESHKRDCPSPQGGTSRMIALRAEAERTERFKRYRLHVVGRINRNNRIVRLRLRVRVGHPASTRYGSGSSWPRMHPPPRYSLTSASPDHARRVPGDHGAVGWLPTSGGGNVCRGPLSSVQRIHIAHFPRQHPTHKASRRRLCNVPNPVASPSWRRRRA